MRSGEEPAASMYLANIYEVPTVCKTLNFGKVCIMLSALVV